MGRDTAGIAEDMLLETVGIDFVQEEVNCWWKGGQKSIWVQAKICCWGQGEIYHWDKGRSVAEDKRDTLLGREK